MVLVTLRRIRSTKHYVRFINVQEVGAETHKTILELSNLQRRQRAGHRPPEWTQTRTARFSPGQL